MITELYRKYRPKDFSEVLGQGPVITSLKKKLENQELPHALLLTGNTGSGKTTIARILKKELRCQDVDFSEINCADTRGVDAIRGITDSVYMRPLSSPCRIWLLDEFHQVTAAGQEVLLKTLEEPPHFAYFFLCSTDPDKIKKTIRNRCLPVALQPLKAKTTEELIRSILKREKKSLSDSVIISIADASEGSARKSLVLLQQVIDLEDELEQLELITKESAKSEAIEICRALFNAKSTWGEVAKVLSIVQEEPETIRRIILSYCTSIMLKAGKNTPTANQIIQYFSDNFYDSGKAGLVSCCYMAFCEIKKK